jgi:hypothetical protein
LTTVPGISLGVGDMKAKLSRTDLDVAEIVINAGDG